MKRGILREVVAAISERGPSTPDDLMPLFPGETRQRVAQAIRNATDAGYLYVYQYGERPFGQRGGKTPSLYALLTDAPAKSAPAALQPRGAIPNVNSVWGLASA
jgi:hypothetical protein